MHFYKDLLNKAIRWVTDMRVSAHCNTHTPLIKGMSWLGASDLIAHAFPLHIKEQGAEKWAIIIFIHHPLLDVNPCFLFDCAWGMVVEYYY